MPFLATLKATQTKSAADVRADAVASQSILRTVISSNSLRFSQFLLAFFLVSVFVESDAMSQDKGVADIW